MAKLTVDDLINLEGVKVPTNVLNYSILLYGKSKIGKTTFIHELFGEKVLFIATENRFKTVAGAKVVHVNNWSEYLHVLKLLAKPELKEIYTAVAVDTTENLYDMLEKYVAAKYDEASLGERNDLWGADWSDVKKYWFDGVNKIGRLGYVPIFVSHAIQKTIQIPKDGILQSDFDADKMEIKKDKKTKEEYVEFLQYTVDLKDKALAPIEKLVDNILFADITVDEDGKEQRALHLRGSVYYDAGVTFKNCVTVIKLDAKEYEKALKDAISKEDQAQTTDEDYQFSYDKGHDFDALMKEVSVLGKQLAELDKATERDKAVESVLGKGKKVKDLDKSQSELLSVVVDKLKELV